MNLDVSPEDREILERQKPRTYQFKEPEKHDDSKAKLFSDCVRIGILVAWTILFIAEVYYFGK